MAGEEGAVGGEAAPGPADGAAAEHGLGGEADKELATFAIGNARLVACYIKLSTTDFLHDLLLRYGPGPATIRICKRGGPVPILI